MNNQSSEKLNTTEVKPMESTRTISNSTQVEDGGDENRNPLQAIGNKASSVVVDDQESCLEEKITNLTIDDSVNMSVKKKENLKSDFCILNKRLRTYMECAKRHSVQLEATEAAKRKLEEKLLQTETEFSRKLLVLREELDEYIRQSVLADEREKLSKKELSDCLADIQVLRYDLAERIEREKSIQCALMSQKQISEKASQEIEELKSNLQKEMEEKTLRQEEIVGLKVINARLEKQMQLKSLELTMQQGKASEAEKKLQFSIEDVNQKLSNQRKQLEKTGLKKFNDLRSKYEQEIEKQKEVNKKLQEKLKSYVSPEEQAKINSEVVELKNSAQATKSLIEALEEQLEEAKNEIKELTKAQIEEKKRRERLNKRLLDQKKTYDEIRQEVETYRRLMEGLDFKENILSGTPLADRRAANASICGSPLRLMNALNRSHEGTPRAAEARRELLKKTFTPRRNRTNSDGDTQANDDDRGCLQM